MPLPLLEPGFHLYPGYDAEYQQTLATLALPVPENSKLPVHAPGSPDDRVIYADGCGAVAAMFAWLLAVEEAALSAHYAGDLETTGRWLGVAALWPETEIFKQYNDPNVPISWYDGVLMPALAGDFSRMHEEVVAARTTSPLPWMANNGRNRIG